jgi:hypothetical protein
MPSIQYSLQLTGMLLPEEVSVIPWLIEIKKALPEVRRAFIF